MYRHKNHELPPVKGGSPPKTSAFPDLPAEPSKNLQPPNQAEKDDLLDLIDFDSEDNQIQFKEFDLSKSSKKAEEVIN